MEEQETIPQPTPEPMEQISQEPDDKKVKKKIGKKKILAVFGVILLLLLIAFLNFTGVFCIQHKWVGADCDEPKHCSKCGIQEGEIDADAHSWNEANCVSPRTCADCGLTDGEKNPENHRWQEATCLVPMTCMECGLTKGEKAAGHSWWSDGTCEWCGISKDESEPESASVDLENAAESDEPVEQESEPSESEKSVSDDESYDSSSDNSKRLSDEELEELGLQTLYSHLVSLEGRYNQFEADYSRYEIATIERDGSGGVEIYGRVAFYDKHGSAVAFGGEYQRNFTVHTTEWGTTVWCEM